LDIKLAAGQCNIAWNALTRNALTKNGGSIYRNALTRNGGSTLPPFLVSAFLSTEWQ